MPESYLTGLDLFYGTAGPSRFRSVVYPMAPVVEWIIGVNATNKDAMQIGLPSSTVVIGQMASNGPVTRREIQKEGQYRFLNKARGKSIDDGDEKSKTDMDTTPIMGASEDKDVLKRFDGPVARMVWRQRAMKVWHSSRDYAKNNSGGDKQRANEAVQDVYDVEAKDTYAVMALGIEAMLFGTHPSFSTGAPTDTSATRWDCLHSFANIFGVSNTIYGVNRALAANAYFRGACPNPTASRAAVLEDLLTEITFQHRTFNTGGYTDMAVCGPGNFQKFRREAQDKGYKMISNDKVPGKLEFGTKQEVIEFKFGSRTVYVLCDPNCPEYDSNGVLITTASQTFSYGHVGLFNSKTFTVIMRGGKNFSKTPWTPQNTRPGGDDADTANMDVELQIVNEVPSWNSYLTHVG